MSAGTVAALRRYPVKSMLGESLEAAELTGNGLLGDRGYAVLDRETGHVASAKHPRKWGRLLACRAVYAEPPRAGEPLPPVVVTLPDGVAVRSGEPETDAVLSRFLGREVSLVAEAPAAPTREADRSPVDGSSPGETILAEPMALAAPAGTFFDYAVLHLLTTATLRRLAVLHPAGRFDPRRFRPNVLVETVGDAGGDDAGFPEQGWAGRTLAFGGLARARVIDPCPRCVVTTLAQDGLPHDPGILRTLARHASAASVTLAPGVVFPAVAGVYATVAAGGAIAVGDGVRLDG